jgi:predicted polyphosphate/ATP-dependent NAD kinase
MDDGTLYLIGPGTTTRAIMEELRLENTLLGIDAVLDSQLKGSDLNEASLLTLIASHKGEVKIILTAIGGQGHILGRGNQQLSPAVLKRVGLANIIIVATKTKITELNGRPLLVDTGDEALDQAMTGFRSVTTGYHDVILYPVGIIALENDSE